MVSTGAGSDQAPTCITSKSPKSFLRSSSTAFWELGNLLMYMQRRFYWSTASMNTETIYDTGDEGDSQGLNQQQRGCAPEQNISRKEGCCSAPSARAISEPANNPVATRRTTVTQTQQMTPQAARGVNAQVTRI